MYVLARDMRSRCGYGEGVAFHGDIYVGRVQQSSNATAKPECVNVDFLLKDMNPGTLKSYAREFKPPTCVLPMQQTPIHPSKANTVENGLHTYFVFNSSTMSTISAVCVSY